LHFLVCCLIVLFDSNIDEIRENDKVQFETEQGKNGLNAVNVELID
tara:strand:- start:81854 stop:81991 length:138 start_codon:yes stop_codon:yes gene_type:complete